MKALVISFQSLNGESAGGTGRISYYVAKRLSQLNLLGKLIVSSKGKYPTDFPCFAVSPVSKYYLFLINKVFRPLGLPYHVQRFVEECLFDFFCKSFVTKDITVIFSTNPYLKSTLRKARRYGIRTVLFPGNPNENVLNRVVIDEFKKIGYKGVDSYSYLPRLDYYNESIPLFDSVFCSNHLIFDTFSLKHQNPKYLKGLVPPLERKDPYINSNKSKEFTVGYLAYSVPLKGLHRLIDVWRKPSLSNVKLYIGGSIDKEYQNYLASEFGSTPSITFLGHVSNLNSFFTKISVLVCPSLFDGQPVTVLEAMQWGVPAIVSEECGVKDFIQDGLNGFIFHEKGLEQLVLTLKNDPDLVEQSGNMARDTYVNYSFGNYITLLTDEVIKSA